MDKAISRPLRIEVVRHVVKTWCVTFPGAKTDDEKEIISAKFHTALAPLFNEEEFLDAARAVEKHVEFFPVLKHFLDVRDQVFAARQRKAAGSHKALPEETDNLSPEEIEQNLEKVQIISDMLTGKLSIDDAVKRQEAITTYARREP
jgi:hypothetical protein